jgi:hypothetical protein
MGVFWKTKTPGKAGVAVSAEAKRGAIAEEKTLLGGSVSSRAKRSTMETGAPLRSPSRPAYSHRHAFVTRSPRRRN